MTDSDHKLLQELEACETGVWAALVDGDATADKRALHADFLGVYADGFASKADHVQQLENGPTIKRFKLSDLHVRRLGLDHAMISYRADFLRAGHKTPEAMYVTSIWHRTDIDWINIFSQDTPATS